MRSPSADIMVLTEAGIRGPSRTISRDLMLPKHFVKCGCNECKKGVLMYNKTIPNNVLAQYKSSLSQVAGFVHLGEFILIELTTISYCPCK